MTRLITQYPVSYSPAEWHERKRQARARRVPRASRREDYSTIAYHFPDEHPEHHDHSLVREDDCVVCEQERVALSLEEALS